MTNIEETRKLNEEIAKRNELKTCDKIHTTKEKRQLKIDEIQTSMTERFNEMIKILGDNMKNGEIVKKELEELHNEYANKKKVIEKKFEQLDDIYNSVIENTKFVCYICDGTNNFTLKQKVSSYALKEYKSMFTSIESLNRYFTHYGKFYCGSDYCKKQLCKCGRKKSKYNAVENYVINREYCSIYCIELYNDYEAGKIQLTKGQTELIYSSDGEYSKQFEPESLEYEKAKQNFEEKVKEQTKDNNIKGLDDD